MQEKGHKCNDNFLYAGGNDPTSNPFLLNNHISSYQMWRKDPQAYVNLERFNHLHVWHMQKWKRNWNSWHKSQVKQRLSWKTPFE